MKTTDPAVQHYWFGKAYGDLRRVIEAAWRANMDAARDYWARMRLVYGNPWKAVPQRLFFFFAACSVVVFGTLTWCLTVPVHVAFILLTAAIVFTLYFLADAAERIYLATRGWKAFCKHCKRKVDLPEYACRNCGNWHATLRPSRYGIFLRRCTCGERIPASFFTGRNRKLTARCPHPGCNRPINAAVDTVSGNTIIAFVGAPSAGKSAYLTALASALLESHGRTWGWDAQFTDPDDKRTYDQLVQDARVHGVTGKTQNEQLPAFNFMVRNVGGRAGQRQLYLCDVAGEAFQRADKMAVQQQLTHATGAIFLLDPFALPDVRAAFEAKLRDAGALSGVSLEDPNAVLNRFVIGLQEHHNLRVDAMVRKPLAIVLTKTDLCGLRAHLRDDASIRRWLHNWGATPLIQQAESRFAKVEFFAAASVARANGSAKYELRQDGVVAPLAWILRESNDPLAPKS